MVTDAERNDFFMPCKPIDSIVDTDDAMVEISLFAVGNVLVHVHPAFVHFLVAFVDGLAGNVRIIDVDVHDEIDEIRQHGGSCRSWTRSRHGDDGGIFAGSLWNGQKTIDATGRNGETDFEAFHLVVRKTRQRR